jgi:hypothetical protein
VLGLTVLAVGATVIGLAALFGRAGAALGALLMVLVGNPLSGVSSAPELLPEPAGAMASCSRRGLAAACCAAPPSSTAPPPAAPWSC